MHLKLSATERLFLHNYPQLRKPAAFSEGEKRRNRTN